MEQSVGESIGPIRTENAVWRLTPSEAGVVLTQSRVDNRLTIDALEDEDVFRRVVRDDGVAVWTDA